MLEMQSLAADYSDQAIRSRAIPGPSADDLLPHAARHFVWVIVEPLLRIWDTRGLNQPYRWNCQAGIAAELSTDLAGPNELR